MPTLVFIQPQSHPSEQPLRGFHTSRRPDSYRVFHNQEHLTFPSGFRFPTAHLHPVLCEQGRSGAENGGLLLQTTKGLPDTLALAPCMRLSPHTAPMQKFQCLARHWRGLGSPDALRVGKIDGFVGWRPARCSPSWKNTGRTASHRERHLNRFVCMFKTYEDCIDV